MRAEPTPGRDAFADLGRIVGAKRGRRRVILRRLLPRLAARYGEYWRCRGAPETLATHRWTAGMRDALRHCYEGETAEWSRIRTRLLEGLSAIAVERCPYCLVRPPASLDHFLPQSLFPEFSTHAFNLVYVCDPCNRAKGDRLTSAPRGVLHPYFDEIPEDVPLVFGELSIIGGVPTITFEVLDDPAAPAGLFDVARRHFEAFDLERTFQREGSALITSFCEELAYRYEVPITPTQLAADIEAKRRSIVRASVNSVEFATLDALDECPELLAHVNDRIYANATAPAPPVRPPRRRGILALARRLAAPS